jgi:molybdate transport system ATP-binding protein
MGHIALYCSNSADKKKLIRAVLFDKLLGGLFNLEADKTDVFSSITIDYLIEEEVKHDSIRVAGGVNHNLETMSSGQQKIALLQHLLKKDNSFLILDDIKSNIDQKTYEKIEKWLEESLHSKTYIQIVCRIEDVIKPIKNIFHYDSVNHVILPFSQELIQESIMAEFPKPLTTHFLQSTKKTDDVLIELKNVSVSYLDNKVLNNLSWIVRSNEFWELRGPVGSGKSTILSMIIGDNPKAYGQNINLFGKKKGSGETVWDIKKETGYFYPKMLQLFKRNFTNQEMIISGFYDSVGLYTKPTEYQTYIASQWLFYLGKEYETKKFQQLSPGQQRIIMLIRAFIKNPKLLILDEPTAGLDDQNALLFTKILNDVVKVLKLAVIYVSHRKEEGLRPEYLFELIPGEEGSVGIATKN